MKQSTSTAKEGKYSEEAGWGTGQLSSSPPDCLVRKARVVQVRRKDRGRVRVPVRTGAKLRLETNPVGTAGEGGGGGMPAPAGGTHRAKFLTLNGNANSSGFSLSE